MIIVSPASPSVRIWEAPRHAQVAADGLIINKLLRVSPFVVRFNSSVPTITFFIIIDNVFFLEAVCEDSLLFIRQFKKPNI